MDQERLGVAISDKGIGMDAKIVVDYYLTAGASFRRSEEWRQMFEDSEGKSKVLRAGRFGIGALASFLVGPEIEVWTRRVDEVEGLKFKARIDSKFIELNRCKMPIGGTTIKIRMSRRCASRLGLVLPFAALRCPTSGWKGGSSKAFCA